MESVDKLDAFKGHMTAVPGPTRLIFSCGWRVTLDGQDADSPGFRAMVKFGRYFGRLFRVADIDNQLEVCRRIFASDTRSTVVRGSDLQESDSQGLPAWSRHVGDPILASSITRPVDFAMFMVEALEHDKLIQEAPAIVSRRSPSTPAHAAGN